MTAMKRSQEMAVSVSTLDVRHVTRKKRKQTDIILFILLAYIWQVHNSIPRPRFKPLPMVFVY